MPDFKPLFKTFLKLIAAGMVYPKSSALITVAPATLKCDGGPTKAIAAAILQARDGKHLVITRIKITLQCACGKVQSLVHMHQGRVFHSLIAAETHRSSVVRQTGNEARILSSAKICEEFVGFAATRSFEARVKEGWFLHEQFEQAKSPALN
jgi:hypothetical protein